jgi:NAD(P)H dehydrogenase (quinone)
MKILVLYYSVNGKTQQMAYFIARGIEEYGAEAVIRTVPRVIPFHESNHHDSKNSLAPSHLQAKKTSYSKTDDCYVSLSDLAHCDGLVIGSPTRFGNMAAPLKYFIDQSSTLWMNGDLAGKPVGTFTSSSSLHGGQELVLLTMMIPFLHHGMLICGLPYSETALLHTQSGGTPYGASHWSGAQNTHSISSEEKELGIAQGKRIAYYAERLKK